MITATIAFIIGVAVTLAFGRRVDCGVIARRERDTAVAALHELVAAAYRKPTATPNLPPNPPPLPPPLRVREARAWSRALSVLACYAHTGGNSQGRADGR